MHGESNVTDTGSRSLLNSERSAGLLLAALGVLVFSLTLPATKLALRAYDPSFIAFGRAALAAALGGVTLLGLRARRPARAQLPRLLIVGGGVVIGFPALSSVALESTSASHGAVVIAILPAATAVAGTVRSRESPSRGFWLAAGAGAGLVTVYALAHAGGGVRIGDLYLLGAVALCAIGYTEGGMLARSLGAPQTICWALLLCLPITLPVALLNLPPHAAGAEEIGGFLYAGIGSMLLGFFAWYGGLARAGVARASQLQLAQTPLTLIWSSLILGEAVGWSSAVVAIAVLGCIAATQRARHPTHDSPSTRSPNTRLV